MSLHDQVPSVLTHGGDSKSAVLSTLSTAAAHHESQNAALGLKSSEAPKGDEVEYPRHVHKGAGEYLEVKSIEEHEVALGNGWLDSPMEIVQTDKPNNGYTSAGEPPFVLGSSPHPRHMHYEEPTAGLPPTLEEVIKAGYSKEVADKIVDDEQSKYKAGYPPYGTNQPPEPNMGNGTALGEE